LLDLLISGIVNSGFQAHTITCEKSTKVFKLSKAVQNELNIYGKIADSILFINYISFRGGSIGVLAVEGLDPITLIFHQSVSIIIFFSFFRYVIFNDVSLDNSILLKKSGFI
jgi:hypothetical protein